MTGLTCDEFGRPPNPAHPRARARSAAPRDRPWQRNAALPRRRHSPGAFAAVLFPGKTYRPYLSQSALVGAGGLASGSAATVRDGSAATVRDGSAATVRDGSAATVRDGSAATVRDGSAATVRDGSAATVRELGKVGAVCFSAVRHVT